MRRKKTTNEVEVLPVDNTIEVTPSSREGIIATCNDVGLDRKSCITALKESLTATKMTIGKDGSIYEEKDHDKRIKGALSGLELLGDLKSKDQVKPTTYNTVIYQWKK